MVLARPGQATADLLNVDRIEVLRGPQGTLFGKNSSAGVINIVTRDPRDGAHGSVDTSYFGGGDEYRFKGEVAGNLAADRLLGSLSAFYGHYGGNVDNRATGEVVNGYQRSGTRIKLLLKPSDSVRVVFNADYMHSIDSIPTGIAVSSSQVAYPSGIVTPNPALAAALAASGLNPTVRSTSVSQDVSSDVRDDNGGISLVADYIWNDVTITSITAWRKWQNLQRQDYDQISHLTASVPQVADHGWLSFYQISEEARVASPKGGRFDYQAGLFYMRAVDFETYRRDVSQLSVAGEVANRGIASFGTNAGNYSVFGEGNLQIAGGLRALLGARVIRDTLSYRFQRDSTAPIAVPAISPSFLSAGSTGNFGYAGRAGLQYELSPTSNAYMTYSRGYNGPAYNVFFNMNDSSTKALKPEISGSYELGLKLHSPEHRVRANAALFLTRFDNYKANFADIVEGALITRLINAGSVSTRGVELDFALQPLGNLTFSGSAAAIRARIDRFNCPPQAGPSCDINGKPLPFAPDWKLSMDARYVVTVRGSLQMVLDSDYRWQSRVQYQLSQTPDTIQGAYGVLNVSLALVDDSCGWSVRALAKNITDQKYSGYLARGNIGGVVRWIPRDGSRYAGIDVHKSF